MIKEDLVNPWNQFNNNYKKNGKETMIWTLEKMYRYLNIMRDWTELIKKIYSFPLKHTEMLDKKKKKQLEFYVQTSKTEKGRSTIRSTIMVLQCLCPNNSYFA